MVGTPVSQLVELVSAGPWRWWVSSSFPRAPPKVCRAERLPLNWAQPPREPVTSPLPQHLWSWRRRRWHHRRHSFPWVPLRPSLAPWEALSFQQYCGGTPIPYHIPQLALHARLFMWVNLKGSGKIYICKQCKKQTSNWDSMVSHCLQEHLGICLTCPLCRMSYSDPSKFQLHSRRIHNVWFY